MSDIATILIDVGQGADWALDGLLLKADDGLLTAVLLSLFTDRQAKADDLLPNADMGDIDRRGWCGDALNDDQTDREGSRLWLNESAKQLDSVLVSDQAYAREALQWMLDDGIASKLDIAAFSPRSGWRALSIGIHRPDHPVTRYQFENFWSNSNAV